MTESAELARRLGLQLHTHLAETVEEEAYCQELYGCTPVEYLDSLGWLDGDVWCAHCVHLSDAEIGRFATTGTGVAHCPTSNLRLGAGIAPVRAMLDAGVRVGLGVDGSALERAQRPLHRRQAGAARRSRPRRPAGDDRPRGAPARHARRRRGARRATTSASIAPGKCADLAVWATDGLELGGAADPVAGLVFAGAHRVDRLYVGGELVVQGGALVRADEAEIARAHRVQAR